MSRISELEAKVDRLLKRTQDLDSIVGEGRHFRHFDACDMSSYGYEHVLGYGVAIPGSAGECGYYTLVDIMTQAAKVLGITHKPQVTIQSELVIPECKTPTKRK